MSDRSANVALVRERASGVGLHLIGQSPAFVRTLDLMRRVAASDATVLIEGETGTGKELAARTIHYLGARRDCPFIPLNCGALPDTLVENELFGHRKGAFTGARGEAPGILRLAHRGTLFLDEADSLAPKAQVALLRFLQDRRYRPLGGTEEEEADVRILAASNHSLDAQVRGGLFREDLYYRLNLLRVQLPPLRTRAGDAGLLAEHFVRECAERYHTARKTLAAETVEWINRQAWPGNVRELENFVHREFLLCEAEVLSIAPTQRAQPDTHAEKAIREPLTSYRAAKARAVEEFDRAYLAQLLAQTRGNVTQAARVAGKERRALGKLLKRYNLSAPRQ